MYTYTYEMVDVLVLGLLMFIEITEMLHVYSQSMNTRVTIFIFLVNEINFSIGSSFVNPDRLQDIPVHTC